MRWRNPYNGKDSYVSFEKTRFIVFWSKNPVPLLPLLPRLKERGIEHNRCIDPELITRLTPDLDLPALKADKGQRPLCGCIQSKDIGAYNTCAHGRLYCYANTSPSSALANLERHRQNPDNDAIV